MNKPEFVEKIASVNDCSKAEGRRVMDYFANAVTSVLTDGGCVNIAGFGQFKLIETQPKQYRHPVTGELKTMDAKRRVKFIPSASLAEAVE